MTPSPSEKPFRVLLRVTKPLISHPSFWFKRKKFMQVLFDPQAAAGDWHPVIEVMTPMSPKNWRNMSAVIRHKRGYPQVQP